MITNPQVGQKVKCISTEPEFGLPSECLHQVGIILLITDEYSQSPLMLVSFPYSVGSRTQWWFCYDHLVPATPKDEQEATKELTKQKERQADQKRRQEHADKYL